MTPDTLSERPRLTVDDIRHHAEEIRAIAVTKAKALVAEDSTKAAVAGFVVVVGLMSLAYYLGTRAACREPVGTSGR